MTEKMLAEKIHNLGISSVIGIPDSTLKLFCEYIQECSWFKHSFCANEGAAVGSAIGSYLATGKPACVYLQNSGLGNLVNPYTSLVHRDIYKIPMLFVIGWRGDDTGHDEPQHKFMGHITLPLLDLLEIPFEVFNKETTLQEMDKSFTRAAGSLENQQPFAFVIQRGTFEDHIGQHYHNLYSLTQEEVIVAILEHTSPESVIVSTTGKISRELYEKLEARPERKKQAFFTVGGMGFSSSIAMGIAQYAPDKRIICLDGDGAILMHMGNLAISGSSDLENFVHICLNNQAYESVGGMPTGINTARYVTIAKACGYKRVWCVDDKESLLQALKEASQVSGPVFIEIGVALSARTNLGRPKESPLENRKDFQFYHWGRTEK